jgi:hypothetical protein
LDENQRNKNFGILDPENRKFSGDLEFGLQKMLQSSSTVFTQNRDEHSNTEGEIPKRADPLKKSVAAPQ